MTEIASQLEVSPGLAEAILDPLPGQSDQETAS